MNGSFKWGGPCPSRARKSRHILRDPFTLALALGLPLLLVVFFGFAIDFNVADVRLAVADRDLTRASRELLQVFGGSGYFHLRHTGRRAGPARLLIQEQTKGVLIIEPRFRERHLGAGKGTRPRCCWTGRTIRRAGAIWATWPASSSRGRGWLGGVPSRRRRLTTRFLFNPELNSRWFIVPGLVGDGHGHPLDHPDRPDRGAGMGKGFHGIAAFHAGATPGDHHRQVAALSGPGAWPWLMIYLIARLQFGIPFRGSHLLYPRRRFPVFNPVPGPGAADLRGHAPAGRGRAVGLHHRVAAHPAAFGLYFSHREHAGFLSIFHPAAAAPLVRAHQPRACF